MNSTLKMLFSVVMQIVPTEYRYLSKEVLPTNQFSVTEYYSPMKQYDRSWPGWFLINLFVCSFHWVLHVNYLPCLFIFSGLLLV